MPDYSAESHHLALGQGPICGVDEAGRGPLAGPVVAAAVIFLDQSRIPVGLDDSKKLSAERRERLYADVMREGIIGVGEASVDEIDLLNIRMATHLAMARAVKALSLTPAFALVDGNDAPALVCPCQTLIGGDGRSLSIAAASIIAKVRRDHIMLRLHRDHPDYGWNSNMGYSTPGHLNALRGIGPSVHHRRSFAPVRLAYQMLGSRPHSDSTN
jgi:ribonuclease HII